MNGRFCPETIVHESRLSNRLSPGAGAVVAVAQGTEVEFVLLGTDLSETSVVEVGSVTKIFTGMLVAQAIERAYLTLNSDICEVLALSRKQGQPILIRHLLTHTSGLPRVSLPWWTLLQRDPYAEYSRDHLHVYLTRRGCGRPQSPEFSYSNLGYAVLGAVLETCYQRPFEELVRNELFGLLGLGESSLADLSSTPVAGFRSNGTPALPWHWKAYAACGALRGTVTELITALRRIKARAGLPRSVYEMDEAPLYRDGSHAVGFGWMFDDVTGWRWHNGATRGSSAYVGIAGRADACIAIVANQELPQEITQLGTTLSHSLSPVPSVPEAHAFTEV